MQIEITHIIPEIDNASTRCRFAVFFSNKSGVLIDAADLNDLCRFQEKVLAQTGQLVRFPDVESSDNPRLRWLDKLDKVLQPPADLPEHGIRLMESLEDKAESLEAKHSHDGQEKSPLAEI